MPSPSITANHPGGNIRIDDREGSRWYLHQELRDTMEDWFYWNFCASGLSGEQTFEFTGSAVISRFGPAISHDTIEWWFEPNITHDPRSFTYEFADPDQPVYFAFAPHYHRAHLDRFLQEPAVDQTMSVNVLTTTACGRNVPILELGDGSEGTILFTCRHHACESTASYLLEAILRAAIDRPLTDQYRIVGVPFVDLDGVQRGDQGKSRAPHDHNRDYLGANEIISGITPLYDSAARMMECIQSLDPLTIGIDLHCPNKWGDRDDHVHFVKRSAETPRLDRFGAALASAAEARGSNCVAYDPAWDIGPTESWNKGFTPTCSWFMGQYATEFGTSLEYPYFGTTDNRITPARTESFGVAFVAALEQYLEIS